MCFEIATRVACAWWTKNCNLPIEYIRVVNMKYSRILKNRSTSRKNTINLKFGTFIKNENISNFVENIANCQLNCQFVKNLPINTTL